MYARAFIILAMVFVVSKVEAAATLRGVVRLNEEGGSPMGNVEVSAVGETRTTLELMDNLCSSFPISIPATRYF